MFLVFGFVSSRVSPWPCGGNKRAFLYRSERKRKKNEKRGAVFSSKPKSSLSSPPHDSFISAWGEVGKACADFLLREDVVFSTEQNVQLTADLPSWTNCEAASMIRSHVSTCTVSTHPKKTKKKKKWANWKWLQTDKTKQKEDRTQLTSGHEYDAEVILVLCIILLYLSFCSRCRLFAFHQRSALLLCTAEFMSRKPQTR